MTLENKDEIAVIKLKQIIDLAKTIDENNCYDLQQVIEAQHTIETLMKELDILYRKYRYLKHAY